MRGATQPPLTPLFAAGNLQPFLVNSRNRILRGEFIERRQKDCSRIGVRDALTSLAKPRDPSVIVCVRSRDFLIQ